MAGRGGKRSRVFRPFRALQQGGKKRGVIRHQLHGDRPPDRLLEEWPGVVQAPDVRATQPRDSQARPMGSPGSVPGPPRSRMEAARSTSPWSTRIFARPTHARTGCTPGPPSRRYVAPPRSRRVLPRTLLARPGTWQARYAAGQPKATLASESDRGHVVVDQLRHSSGGIPARGGRALCMVVLARSRRFAATWIPKLSIHG